MPHYLRYCKPLLSLKMKKIELFNVSLAKLALSNLAQLIYAFCLSSRICNNQKFSLTCVLEDFSLVSIKRRRGSFIFFGGGGAGAEVEAGGIWCVAHDDPVFIRQCLGATPFSLKMFEMIPLPAPSKKKKGRRKKLSQIKRMKLNLNHSIARNASAPTPRWRVRPSWLKQSC